MNDLFLEMKARGQEQVLRFWDELSPPEREELARQIRSVDWETVSLWSHPEDLSGKGEISPIEGLSVAQIGARRAEFTAVGERAIREGKVAAVLLAGGQGTRLGSNAPKGTFDIGITRPVYIFGRLIANLLDVTERCGAYVPLLVMTSEKNDAETRAFFEAHGRFGYPSEYLRFFCQDMVPSVDFGGKLLLEGKGRLALSPNGNAGWYSSLMRSGLMKEFPETEWYNVFAVDNVLQRIADPAFIGATILSGCKSGAKVVSKAAPEERVGVLCLDDGLPTVIEYYELTDSMAHARGEGGELLYRYGVILNYLFDARRLKEVAAARIPVHVVKKKVPFVDETGALVSPGRENAYKFETLILDMISLMGSCLPFEVEREREFAPVKNRTGTDSVDSARELLLKNGVEL